MVIDSGGQKINTRKKGVYGYMGFTSRRLPDLYNSLSQDLLLYIVGYWAQCQHILVNIKFACPNPNPNQLKQVFNGRRDVLQYRRSQWVQLVVDA